MTYNELLNYYADLLIIQYRGKPKAQATLMALAREALIDNLPLKIQEAFGLEDAVGKQLDMIGKYAGVVREILTFTGGATLNDSDYRKLVKLAMARNSCQGSLKDIDDLLKEFFGNAIIAFDNKDMGLSYFFNANLGSVQLAEAFVQLDLLPRPMGVQLSSLIYAGDLENVFGFGSYYAPPFEVSGMQTYDDYETTPNAMPWLSYEDTITL